MGFFKKLFGGGKPPPPVVAQPEVPSRSDEEIQAAAAENRRRLRSVRGRASTIKTGGAGLGDPAPVASSELMGGGTQLG